MDMFGKGAGYRWLDAYLLAWIVELATDSFCAKYLDYRSDPQGKTSGQMNHAARSGCRNFAEGCERLMTSTSSELDLLNVAKGSLGELRDDYLKWLMRERRLPWDVVDPEAMAVQGLDLDPAPASSPLGEGRTAGTAGTAGTAEPGSPGRSTRYTHRRFCEHLLRQYAAPEPPQAGQLALLGLHELPGMPGHETVPGVDANKAPSAVPAVPAVPAEVRLTKTTDGEE